ncbi:hypothetical protein PPERSA_10527 [Pseudocohnilembus persalinus]|uniref:Uncharacterized protein n=1 Tax=Pseudocohnilembus persalinus TaxID=266149 RepID=A0A0V0R7H3_PSEPJ|nr:hypothetical protein PPERSA_10527 [Pseudocohnilembus persalinus]|eukprot:KRX10428.1 hypothetical protein PPERSA_10527 [Pseudocohnilembus persalinus]
MFNQLLKSSFKKQNTRILNKNFIRSTKQFSTHQQQQSEIQNQQNGIESMVSQILTQRQQQGLGEQQYQRFIENLERVRRGEEKRNKIFESAIQKYITDALVSPNPLKSILQVFQQVSKSGFDQQLLTETFSYLAKTFASLQEGSMEGDFAIKDLHDSWSFLDMIEDVKYGLKSGVQFDVKNIASIAKSLQTLNYKNSELQVMILEKLERILKNEDSEFEINLEDLSKNPQIHKKHYYDSTVININSLLEDPLFQNQLQTLNKIHEVQQNQEQEKLEQGQQQQTKQQQEQQDLVEVQQIIDDISTLVNSQEQNLQEVISSIISLRDQYFRLTQNQKLVQNDAHFNLQLLELEEVLVQNGFISPEEIQYPTLLQDFDHQVKQTSVILEEFVGGNNENIKAYLKDFYNQLNKQAQKQQVKQEQEAQRKQQQILAQISNNDIASLLQSISQIASMKKQDATGQNYISATWEKTLNVDKEYKKLDIEYMDIDCDRIYTKCFLESYKKFKEIEDLIAKKFEGEQSLQSLLKLSSAYLSLGLTKKSSQLLTQIGKIDSLATQISELDLNQLHNLCHALCFFSQNQTENKELNKIVKNEIGKRVQKKEIVYVDEFLNFIEFFYITSEFSELNKQNQIFIDLVQGLQADITHIDSLTNFSAETQAKIANFSLLLNSNQQLQQEFSELASQLNGYKAYAASKDVSPIREKIVEYLESSNKTSPNQTENLESIRIQSFPEIFRPDYTVYDLKDGKQVQKGLYLVDSEYVSMEENLVDGRFKFWATLLQKQYNIEPLFVRYLSIDGEQIKVHNTELIQQFVQKQQPVLSYKLQIQFLEYLNNNKELQYLATEVNRIFERIEVLQQKLQEGVEILALSYAEEIKYSLFELNSILTHLNSEQLKELQKNVGVQDISAHLKEVSKQFGKAQNVQIQEQLQKYDFIGKRLSSTLLGEKQQQVGHLNFVNIAQLNKKGYHDYKDWEQQLVEELNIGNLMHQKLDKNAQLFVGENEISKNNLVHVIPSKKVDRFILRPLSYPLQWESFYLEQLPEKSEKNQKLEYLINQSENGNKIGQNTKFIANLQNFKYELRRSDQQQMFSLLEELEFIDNLAQSHLDGNKCKQEEQFGQAVPRSGDEYFTYLENNGVEEMYNSDYLQFFIEKAQKKQKLIALWKQKNQGYVQEQYQLMQKGKISRKQFNNIQKNINEELLDELKSLDDNSKEDVLLQGPSRKFVEVKLDINTFIQDKKGNNYNRYQDQDFLDAQGDVQQALQTKRFRAEQQLIKTRILYKLQNEIKLSQNETKYAQAWSQGKLQDNEFTYRSIKTLSEKDQNTLKQLKFSDLTQFEDFPLSDIILEFSQLFNSNLIKDIDFQITQEQLKTEWNVNTQLLNSLQINNSTNYLVQEAENLAWQEGQVLTENDQQDILDMMAILQDKTPNQRKKLEIDQEQDREALDQFNQLNSRLPLIEKYLELREKENNKKVDVIAYNKKGSKKIELLWEKVFQSKQEDTNEQQLHIFIHNLVQRFHLLNKFQPIIFSQFLIQIMTHPNLNLIDKEILLAFLNVFQPDIKLNSQEVVQLAQQNLVKINKQSNLGSIKEKIRQNSQNNNSLLLQKLRQL